MYPDRFIRNTNWKIMLCMATSTKFYCYCIFSYTNAQTFLWYQRSSYHLMISEFTFMKCLFCNFEIFQLLNLFCFFFGLRLSFIRFCIHTSFIGLCPCFILGFTFSCITFFLLWVHVLLQFLHVVPQECTGTVEKLASMQLIGLQIQSCIRILHDSAFVLWCDTFIVNHSKLNLFYIHDYLNCIW